MICFCGSLKRLLSVTGDGLSLSYELTPSHQLVLEPYLLVNFIHLQLQAIGYRDERRLALAQGCNQGANTNDEPSLTSSTVFARLASGDRLLSVMKRVFA